MAQFGSNWRADLTFRSLAVHNNRLIVAARYTFGIRAWDGNSWETIAASVGGGDVVALMSFQGDLFAGGTFSGIDGVSEARSVARWDGVAWYALGRDLEGTSTPAIGGSPYSRTN